MTGQLTIVYGGQFGSEGKGQVARLLTEEMETGMAVRVGGPNAGHSFYPTGAEGPPSVVQTIPVSLSYKPMMWSGVIGSAGIVELGILHREMTDAYARTGVIPELVIDQCASIITEEHQKTEEYLKGKIGSTGKGVGSATASKVMRDPEVVFKSETVKAMVKYLQEIGGDAMAKITIKDTSKILNEFLMVGGRIMIEGTQGYALSLNTSGYYPFTTSRECTPTAMLSQTGINHELAGKFEKIMVCRTFPIRVGGNSGPIPNEISWETLMEETSGYIKKPEITTVTKKARRIARIDFDQLHRAIMQTGPTALCIAFLDYMFPKFAGEEPNDFSVAMHQYINQWEMQLRVPVKYVSTCQGRTFAYNGEKYR